MAQAASPMLALIDECFVHLGWKADYVAARFGINPGTLSRAKNEKDGKVFDLRWLDRLMDDKDFWVTFHDLIGKKHQISTDTHVALVLRDATQVVNGLARILERVAVSA